MEIKSLGRQLLAEYYGCDVSTLNDVDYVREVMQHAVREAGATVVGQIFHRFSPHGVSGVVVIAESHFAIHTWPEYGYAAIDLFTCGDEVDPYLGFDFLKSAFQAQKTEVRELTRGLEQHIGRELHHKPLQPTLKSA